MPRGLGMRGGGGELTLPCKDERVRQRKERLKGSGGMDAKCIKFNGISISKTAQLL